MRKGIIAIFVLLLGGTVSAIAQDQSTPQESRSPRDGRERLARITEMLELTEDQQVAIQQVFDSTRTQLDKLRTADLSREEKLNQMEVFLKAQNETITGLLTEEQAKEWAEMKEKARNRRHNRKGSGQ